VDRQYRAPQVFSGAEAGTRREPCLGFMDFQLALPTGVRDLELPMGTWTAGGGRDDEVQLPGFPAGLFCVRVSPGHATLEAVVPLVMSGLPLPPRVERLWMPGETVVLSRGVRMRRGEPSERTTAGRTAETNTWPTRNPTLVCVMGDGLGRTWCLSNRELQVGRASNAHVRLHAVTVSRQHAALVQHRSNWLLVPHHTKNPTRLNGRRIVGARALSDGDIIEVGAVALRFVRPYEPPPPPSPPSRAPRTAILERPVRKTPRKVIRALWAVVDRALCW
jgi:FHA domain